MTAEMRAETPHDPRITFGPLRLDPRTLIYSTILMLTAVALLDPSDDLFDGQALAQAFWLLLGPLFAISMAHGFSEAIDLQIRLRRRLTWADRRHLLVVNLQYLIIGVVAWLSLLAPLALHATVSAALTQLQVLGIGSLVGWGIAAAHHAGLPPARQVVTGLSYGILGVVIVVIELWLRH